MGGFSYDRDVYDSSSSSGWGSSYSGGYGSSVASSKLSATTLDKTMHPLDKRLKSSTKHPIIIMLDVTGSNTDFAKIVYDKMPMFYGQIEQKGYLKDFEISICAIGDAYSDDYPLQIADFAKGIEIDSWLQKLVLEGCGGGQKCETYELAAYYLLHKFDFESGTEPIVFFLGDEGMYDTIPDNLIREYIEAKHSSTDSSKVQSSEVFSELIKKIPNTFAFINPYNGYIHDNDILNKWHKAFKDAPKHVIQMQKDNEKAIIDLLLGIIAMIGEKDLDSYIVDMIDRGQDKKRIDTVDSTLKSVSTELAVVKSATVTTLNMQAKGPRSKTNKRL